MMMEARCLLMIDLPMVKEACVFLMIAAAACAVVVLALVLPSE
jgi:hypothetical protein